MDGGILPHLGATTPWDTGKNKNRRKNKKKPKNKFWSKHRFWQGAMIDVSATTGRSPNNQPDPTNPVVNWQKKVDSSMRQVMEKSGS